MALFVDIEKKLGNFHLQVKFEAGRDMLAILGASGCGKSMTLKCIAGIETPDKGRIVLDDTVLFDSEKHINLKPQKRMVGYLFQQYALFPNMTALENVMCGVRTGTKAEKRKKAAEIFDRLHLSGCEEKKPSMLSGGQQQRCALARILVNEPRVLLLDEPFSALDAHLRFHTERQVDGILKEFGITTILVSHDRDEVFRLTDHIAVMENGRFHAMGEKHAVFHEPETIEGAILTGCKNISRAEISGHTNTRDRAKACGRDEASSAGKVFAADWGIYLSVGEIPDEIRGVGIRMHDVLICEEDISAEKASMSETNTNETTKSEPGIVYTLPNGEQRSEHILASSKQDGEQLPLSNVQERKRYIANSDNVFRCHVIGEIENPFSYSVMLRPVIDVSQITAGDGSGADVSGYNNRKAGRRENDRYILIDLPKARWNAIRTDVLTVRIPADRILLLR